MKSRICKLVAVISLVAVIVCTMAISVSAEVNTQGYLYSSAATAGSYHTESPSSLTTPNLSTVWGGDMGIWFYANETLGLNASFYKTTDRKAYIECWESDGTNNTDVRARKYEGDFGVNANGIYRTTGYRITSTSSSLMEGHSTIEPYMKFKIGTNSKDTSKAVPKNFFKYQFWVY